MRTRKGGFCGEVPALPGCYSQSETIDELMEVREAITGVLEVMKEQGTRPESKHTDSGHCSLKAITGPEMRRWVGA